MKLSPKLNLPIPEGSDIHNLVNFVALLNAIDNNAAPLGTMTDHINSKNNPHAVTKEQLGLGQVNNVPQYSKTEIDSKLAELSKASQLPADSIPPTSTPASYPTGTTVMTVTTGYPGATTNSPKTVMTVRGSVDRGSYQMLIGSNDTAPQNRIYDGTAWGAWFTIATTLSNVASATKLANARQIGGVAFDGTSDITLPGVNAPGNQPTSGKAATAGRADSAGTADNASTANKLATARQIGGVAFDGSADISLPGVNTTGNQDTSGRAATAGRAETSGIADVANKLTTARKIGGVNFDGSADIALPGVNTPGNQDTSGKAATAGRADTAGIADVANKLATAHKIGGVNFDGSTDVTLPGVNAPGNQPTSGKAVTAGTADTANKLTTARKIGGVDFNGSADIALPGVNIAGNQDTSGNARTAARLQTARNINGVGFDGSSDVTVDPVVRHTDPATDLFTLTNGFYCNYGAVLTNMPAGVGSWFTVEVVQAVSDGFMRLIDNKGVSYWIAKYNSIWHDWHRDADDSTVVHNSGNEVVAGSKSFSDVLMALAGIKGDVTGSLHGNADTATKLAFKDTLADGTDLNTIQTTGLYQWFGATFTNGPVTRQSWGYMDVTAVGNMVIQTFYADGLAQEVYNRVMSGSPAVWNTWQKAIFANDKIANATHADTADSATTANDPQAVHVSGDQAIAGNKTFNGQILANLPLKVVPDAGGNVLIGKSSKGDRGLIQQIAGIDTNGDLVGLGAGGTTIVGSGESSPNFIAAIKAGKVPAAFGTLYADSNAGAEATIIASDGDVFIVTNYQNSGTSGSVVKVGTDGYIYHWINGAWVKSALVTDIIANATHAGNADTATKLQTSRNINGVGFDGSSDITIDPSVRIVDPTTDLFTLANGFYIFGNALAAPNKPTNASNWFTVEVVQNASNGFMRLIDSNGLSFWTTKSAGKWWPWRQDAEKSDITDLAYTVTKTF
jgi:hypothetical protein